MSKKVEISWLERVDGELHDFVPADYNTLLLDAVATISIAGHLASIDKSLQELVAWAQAVRHAKP